MTREAFRRTARSLLVLMLLLSASPAMSSAGEDTPSVAPEFAFHRIKTEDFGDGTGIDAVVINGPPTPPRGSERPTVSPSELAPGANVVLAVPAYKWSYGCTPTSASMIAAFYDRNGYPDMYTGGTNGGVMPMDNNLWGTTDYTRCDTGETQAVNENPLAATHREIDGRATAGHVDDYWIGYLCPGPDPWSGGSEHTADSLGDFMESNKWFLTLGANIDGGTRLYFYDNGAPLYATTLEAAGPPYSYDGGLGIKQFYESKGYTVLNAYNQYREGYDAGQTDGFTFDQYKAEIDAGRPVIVHVEGHSMVGVGYDDSMPNRMYIHDTWDYLLHTMTWGGTYSGMLHVGVTITQLAATPTAVELATFDAQAAPDGTAVLLNWETATELDSSGFNLYRAGAMEGAKVRLNDTLIAAQNPGGVLGASYSFLDQAVEVNATYYYWLEDVSTTGATTLHGPEVVSVPFHGRLRLIRPRPSLRPGLEGLK